VEPSVLAACITLDRMYSDNETPRDLALFESMSRSQGSSLMATRAVRWRDSERLRGLSCSRTALAPLTAIVLSLTRVVLPGPNPITQSWPTV
jgi:hypothetical protein